MTNIHADEGDTKTETAGKPATSKHPKNCGCLIGTGKTCDRTTQRAFAQGHDARLASRLAQAVADEKDPTTVEHAEKLIREVGGSDLLVGKMKHSAELRKTNASKPPKAPKTPKAPKAEAELPMDDSAEGLAVQSAGNNLLGRKVKVTHKGEKGTKEYDAVIVRNAAERVVARHRLIGQTFDHEVTDEGVTGEKIK